MLPFRTPSSLPRLREGYQLQWQEPLQSQELDALLQLCGERPRGEACWARVLERSTWHLALRDGQGRLVGFLRATSDLALNANLWDLLSDPADPARQEVIQALVQLGLNRLRRELSGCSISLSAPPEALEVLNRAGFVIDPGGIRAMGLPLNP